jgi:hypothetical protein
LIFEGIGGSFLVVAELALAEVVEEVEVEFVIGGAGEPGIESRKIGAIGGLPVGEKSEADVSSGTVVVASEFISGIRAFNGDECVAETKGHAV